MTLPEGARIAKSSDEAPKVKAASDCDPREFLLDVEAWPEDKPIKLTVTYSAYVADACHMLKQDYVLHLCRDRDGGGVLGAGAGFWDEEFARQRVARSKRGDGKVDRSEVMGLLLPHFDKIDTNKDGYLDVEELKVIADWLNKHHQPGVPQSKPKK